MLAKGALDRLDGELVESLANGGMGRCALPTQSTQRIQPFTTRVDETLDLPVGRGARQDRQNTEEQEMTEVVDLTLGTTRIGNAGQTGLQQQHEASSGFLETR